MFIDKAAPNKQDAHCPAVLATPCICSKTRRSLAAVNPAQACVLPGGSLQSLAPRTWVSLRGAACLLLPGQALSQQQLAALCHSLLQG